MSWKLGLQDTDFDPEIHGDVDFSFFSGSDESAAASKAPASPVEPNSEQHPVPSYGQPPDIRISPVEPRPHRHSIENGLLEATGATAGLNCSYSDEDFESSSEGDADSEEDDDGGDITEVSPLSSPNLSPFLPRRKRLLAGALHRKFRIESESEDDSEVGVGRQSRQMNRKDPLGNMKSLSDTLKEIENKRPTTRPSRHLTPTSNIRRQRRFNMSFSNDDVVRIDRENQLLLRKILHCHNRPASFPMRSGRSSRASSMRLTSSRSLPNSKAMNRAREQRRIDFENFVLLKKIQAARPSSEIEESLKGAAVPHPRVSRLRVSGQRERQTSGSTSSSNVGAAASASTAIPKSEQESKADVGWISW